MREYRTDINAQEYPRLRLYSWIYSIFAAIAIVALVFTLWFTSIMVLDDGMSPAFEDGDIILFNRLTHHIRTPRRGEAYIYECGGTRMGRIVGLPGDSIAIQDGRVFIDGLYLDESSYATLSDWDTDSFTLRRGEFLLLPDDRTLAPFSLRDSLITGEQLIGKAALRVAPFGRAAVFTAVEDRA